MNTKFWWLALSLALLAVLAAACNGASPVSGSDLVISDIWARESPAVGGNGAIFMQIENTGKADDALVAASSGVSSAVELHETQMENDVMRMRPVPGQRIEIPAGSQVTLQPGGLHIMLIDLKQPLVAGDSFDITLRFENMGERTLTVAVRALDAVN